MNYVLIGKSVVIARKIRTADPESNITIFDEDSYLQTITMPEEIKTNHYTEFGYHQTVSIVETIGRLNQIGVDAIIPSFERTVTLANQIAEGLNLPRIGDLGARIFRNKAALREFCRPLLINQPAYQPINSINQLRAFFNQYGAIVLKPTTLAGSMGVVKITEASQLEKEYTFSRQIGLDTSQSFTLMAEQMIVGSEYSCEFVVQNGHVIFRNITKKFKFHNDFFVESGHLIPAIINDDLRQDIYQMMNCLVDAAKVKTAVLHAEWLVNSENKAYLVECAGRRPGDRIVDLLTEAYDQDFLWQYCQLLANKKVKFENNTAKFASQTYFDSQPGRIIKIESEAELAPYRHQLDVSVGDTVPIFSDSDKRVGYVIISNPDYFKLQDTRQKLLQQFKILTKKV